MKKKKPQKIIIVGFFQCDNQVKYHLKKSLSTTIEVKICCKCSAIIGHTNCTQVFLFIYLLFYFFQTPQESYFQVLHQQHLIVFRLVFFTRYFLTAQKTRRLYLFAENENKKNK